jgi:phage terminase large subunit-like protein
MDEPIRTNTGRPRQARDRNGGEPKQARQIQAKAGVKGWQPRWLTPCDPGDLERSLGDEVADFAEALIPIAKDSLAGKAGEPIKIRGWQRELLRHMLATRTDGTFAHRFYLAGIARKNGKSSLASILPIYFGLFGDHGGEIYGAASTREQASLVLQHAKRAVEMTPELSEQIKVYRNALEFKPTGTVYKTIAAEAYSSEGLSASLILADELGAWPSRDLFDVLSLSMGARRSPLMVAITTAGPRTDTTGADSIAYTLYQLAKRRISGESDDTTLGMAWWEAAEDAYADQTRWHEANPGLLGERPILSFEDLVSAQKRTPEAEFRTKRLQQFTAGTQAWLPDGAWAACADPDLVLNDGDEIVVSHDGSFSNDSTAQIACRISDRALFVVGHWERPIDADLSWRVPVEEVEANMLEVCRRYTVKEIICDPFRWQRSMEQWAQMGLPVSEMPQSSARMVPATSSFFDAVVNKRLAHNGDPRLSRHAANATPYYSRQGLMIKKETRNSNRKIDLLVAAIMAHARAGTLSSTDLPKARPAVAYIEL